MKPTDFAIRLSAFFLDYLSAQRNVSPNTSTSTVPFMTASSPP